MGWDPGPDGTRRSAPWGRTRRSLLAWYLRDDLDRHDQGPRGLLIVLALRACVLGRREHLRHTGRGGESQPAVVDRADLAPRAVEAAGGLPDLLRCQRDPDGRIPHLDGS